MKKTELIMVIITFTLLVIVIITLIFFQTGKNTTNQPTSTLDSSTTIQQESKAQQDYANSRGEFINNKPWILKLPLTGDNYFVSYDPENNQLLVTIYYTSNNIGEKQRQLNLARQQANQEIIDTQIDLNQENIKYIETKREL